jgi:hypothetical protein
MLDSKAGRFLLVAVIATLAVSVMAGPAQAAPDGWIDCDQLPNHPDCELGGQTPGGDGSVVAGPGGAVTCLWEGEEVDCVNDEGAWWGGDGCYYLRVDAGPPSGEVTSGAAYVPTCFGDPPNSTRPAVWIPDSEAPGPAMLARVATSRLVLPVPQVELAPPLPAAQLVRLPTWWWISDDVWRARSASASVPGVTVTAVGTPVASVWDTGDGAEVSCEGPGTPYTGGAGAAEAGSPDCGHTYQRSSAGQPGGAYPVRVTITWQVSWSGGDASGTLGPLFSTSTVEVPVAEVQAVVTS